MLPIVKAPHPILSAKAKKVGKIDATIHRHIMEMVETLENAKDPEGVGLAAVQVGIPLQLFVVKSTRETKVHIFINPVIEKVFDDTDKKKSAKRISSKRKKSPVKLEGCLSVDDIWGVVTRHRRVTISFLDENGVAHKKTYSGFLATIIQHEIDHLHGILFTKRVLEQKEKLYKSSKDEKGEVVFEEVTV